MRHRRPEPPHYKGVRFNSLTCYNCQSNISKLDREMSMHHPVSQVFRVAQNATVPLPRVAKAPFPENRPLGVVISTERVVGLTPSAVRLFAAHHLRNLLLYTARIICFLENKNTHQMLNRFNMNAFVDVVLANDVNESKAAAAIDLCSG